MLHGGKSDVIWLQRDFGLYLVSSFDTYFAALALQLPFRSLAFLLSKYVEVEADKKYQLADWRIRPLPAEMLAYARSDTHYLLYIYDHLRKELDTASVSGNTDLLGSVLDASRNQAVIAYRRERYDFAEGSGPDGWRKLLQSNRGPNLHSNLQLAVFKRLHRWRDQIAREEDESVSYVLPNRSLMNIAATLPHNMQSVVAACHPVPPLVQVYAEDIAYIVAKTRKELAEDAAKAEALAADSIKGAVDASIKNRVTGATHVWYKDEVTPPNGVRSVMEAVQHGTQFDIWASQKGRLHSLILPRSQFWEPLKRDYVIGQPLYEIGGQLEDIKLSVPLPPLTAQIYMSADDITVTDNEGKDDNVAALAEHPFIKRSEEEREKSKGGAEIIVVRKMEKKKKRARQSEPESEETTNERFNDQSVVISPEDKPIRAKSKPKRRKKEKLEEKIGQKAHTQIEQFDPYKVEETPLSTPIVQKPRGQGAGKSMTFKV